MTERSLYDQALTILSFRARTEMELRRKLRDQGAAAADIDAVIDKLRDQKVLNDADFARQFTRSKLAAAGTSRRRIAQELGRKGIARDLAEEALRELTEEDGVDPTAAARRVAEKKWKALADLDDFTRRRRVYAFLARRGFDPDEIQDVMRGLGEDRE